MLSQCAPRGMIELPTVRANLLGQQTQFPLQPLQNYKNALLDAGATSLIGFPLQEKDVFLQSKVYVKNNKTAQKSHNAADIKQFQVAG